MARDGAFEQVVATQKTQDTRVRYANLAAGGYHWRVHVALGKQSAASEDRTIMVVDDRAPTPLEPHADATVDVSRRKKEITLAWTPVPGAGHYQVELSDTKETGVQTWRSPYAGLSVNAAPLEEGSYCYRVRADEPERGASPWSKAQCFRIITHTVLKAPKLLEPAPAAPAPHKQGLLWRLVGGTAYADEGAPPPVVLRWEALEGAVAYGLEVANDNAMGHVVARMKVNEPFYRWQPPESRLYYWRVRGVDGDGREGEPSVVEVLDARPPSAASPAPVVTPTAPVKPPAKTPPPPVIVQPKPIKPRQSAVPGKIAPAANLPAQPSPPPTPPLPPVAAPPAAVHADEISADLTPPFNPSGWVGARVALYSNFGGVTTVQPGIEFGAWVANRWDTQFGVRLGVDYHTASVGAASSDGLVHVSSRLQRVPITLTAMGLWPFRIVDVTGAVGLRAAWTYVAQGVTGQTSRNDGSVEWGGVFAVGVQRALGPGALFAELAYDVTNEQSSLAEDAPDGLALALGYRLRVF